jgi:hypothetical protein
MKKKKTPTHVGVLRKGEDNKNESIGKPKNIGEHT